LSDSIYSRRLFLDINREIYTEQDYIENDCSAALDKIFCSSSENMKEVPDESVHLVVTSPPYNVGKEYEADLTLAEWRALMGRVWAECWRVLVKGGRLAVNVASVARKPTVPLHFYVLEDMLALGFLLRAEVIWNKDVSRGPRTSWGSFRSPSDPIIRDEHEYILIFSKGMFRRPNPLQRPATISKEEFLLYTRSVWQMRAEGRWAAVHPAVFPEELPSRLIQLYTFLGEVVLDPFMGLGTTAVAAKRLGRHYIGYEVNAEYCRVAEQRLAQEVLLSPEYIEGCVDSIAEEQ